MAKSFNQQMKDRFTRITASYDKANKYVHETAMMILDHAQEHGDCSSAQGLVMALPASIRREMLVLWFSKFTPIVVKNDDKWVAKMHKKDSKLFVEFDRDSADATPFYELAKQNPEKPALTLEALMKLLESLPKRLEKMIEEDKVDPSAVEATRSAIAQARAIKISVPTPAPANSNGEASPAPETVAA